ncbi:MAG: T9SS type A sorting domain-containing protein [Bacteroidota bacterium]
MRPASLTLLALLLTSGSASAQSPLLVSPETLYYPIEEVVTITNVSNETVSLDSIAIGIGGPRAYDVELVMPDSTYGPRYLNPFYETNFSVGANLDSGEPALLRVLGFDPCVVCAGGGSGLGPDTLLVYSGGGAVPDTTLIDLSTYVATEHGPKAPPDLHLVAYPNPTSGDLTLSFGTTVTTGVEVTTIDVLGRIVGRQRLAAGANPELVLQTSGLSAGIYHVRARADGGSRAVLLFTVTR